MKLVMELSNNTRIWENNGHTPMEIFEKLEKPNMRPLPKVPFDFNATNVIDMKTRKKIGRNDPCPCGSGKKYKKCCLGKDE
jgi:preprotein translocase subunit SecA